MNNKFPYKSVLIVCSVGVARSPMAAGFLQYFFSKKKLKVDVQSGGIASHARDGMLISMDAKLAMKEIGIELSETATSKDLKKHRNLIKKAELILTLTEDHKKEILKFPESKNKMVITLKEFSGKRGDIEDPSMKDLKGFRVTRDEIRKCLLKGLKKYAF
ncbi:MAG: arsenate reductase/protein-tyrosine-phosphatase family protein [Promethearchaeota archaeon]